MFIRRHFLLGALALAADRNEQVAPLANEVGDLSLAPSAWDIGPTIKGQNYSLGMPPHPSAEGASWFFDFPQADGVHYLTTNVRGSATARVAISAKFTISGSEFHPTQGDVAARVRLYLQRHGDNWSGEGEYEFFRWYSFTFVELLAGAHQLTAALLPEQWFSVMGKGGVEPAVAGGFIAAVSDLGAVGLTFGGTFAGHGVYAVGPARFVLTSYIIA